MRATMTNSNGYNPRTWDCATDGCELKETRFKTEIFCDCFGGKISFSDIDSVVERNGYFLVIEWKRKSAPLLMGQEILLKNLTRNRKGNAAYVIWADPKTSMVFEYKLIYDGVFSEAKPCTVESLKKQFRRWWLCADNNDFKSKTSTD